MPELSLLGTWLPVPAWLLVLLLCLLGAYLYGTWTFSDISSLGFPQEKPVAFLGNIVSLSKAGLHFYDLQLRNKYKRKSYGTYFGRIPMLVLGDVRDIKRLCIKEFSSASNHTSFYLSEGVTSSLFVSRGERWQNQRQCMTPAFSGFKLKLVTPWIQDCSELMLKHVLKQVDENGYCSMKQISNALGMDVIAGTVFGIRTDALNNPDSDFVRYGTKFNEFSLNNPGMIIALFCQVLIPVIQFLKISSLPKDAVEFFSKITEETLKRRKEQVDDTARVDLLQLMLDRVDKAESLPRRTDAVGPWVEKGLTEEEVLHNSMMILSAGYETTASSLAFLAYNLALHTEVQDRVIEELDRELQGAKPDYDNIQKLQYLEQVMNENLRIFPPITRTDRELSKSVEIDGKAVPAGTNIGIPIYAIHHDPDIWPHPEKFDPDRFVDGARGMREEGKFLPFGAGPRMCIASRLALLELKIAICTLLQAVRLERCTKTEVPIQLVKVGLLSPLNEVYLVAKRRGQ